MKIYLNNNRHDQLFFFGRRDQNDFFTHINYFSCNLLILSTLSIEMTFLY